MLCHKCFQKTRPGVFQRQILKLSSLMDRNERKGLTMIKVVIILSSKILKNIFDLGVKIVLKHYFLFSLF